MITSEQWLNTFKEYNTDYLPVLILKWLVLIIVLVLYFVKQNKSTGIFLKLSLAFAFFWNGVVFFFSYMKSSLFIGGIPMLLVSTLFVIDIFRHKLEFKLSDVKWKRNLTLFMFIYATVLYTFAGWLLGYRYPGGPILLAPCPLTIFTIVLMSQVESIKNNRLFYLLHFVGLLWWSFASGITAPLAFGFYLDFTLLATGIFGLIVLIKKMIQKN